MACFCKGKIPRLGTTTLRIFQQTLTNYCEQGWKSMGDWLGTGNGRTKHSEDIVPSGGTSYLFANSD